MRRRLLALLLAAPLTALAAPASAVTIDWVPIGNPGNAPDTPSNCWAANCGSVAYAYRISKYEVTNAQYAEFLNAVAASDPLALYNPAMGSYPSGGITRSGADGGYTYTVKAGFEDKPVIFVSFWDALRFSNWLHNGQGSGDTETGAYTITLRGIARNDITRNPGATAFLSSENEWYKAAYHGPAGGYFDFAAGTDDEIVTSTPTATPNRANCGGPAGVGTLTDVGSYTGSASPWGTFDQAGNVFELNEQIVENEQRGVRGGSWIFHPSFSVASWKGTALPDDENENIGFRVATLAPEPSQVLLAFTGGLVLSVARRQRRAQPPLRPKHGRAP